jgi:hypothetical protein
MNQDKVTRLSDVEKSAQAEDKTSKNVKPEYKPSYSERWNKIRPTKTIVFWSLVVTILLTMSSGFNWGGWVTGGTAQKMTNDAVVHRLSSICVAQFNYDPQKDQKLTELKETTSYQRDDYVKEQGWATMPGEDEPDRNVADACAKQLTRISQ